METIETSHLRDTVAESYKNERLSLNWEQPTLLPLSCQKEVYGKGDWCKKVTPILMKISHFIEHTLQQFYFSFPFSTGQIQRDGRWHSRLGSHWPHQHSAPNSSWPESTVEVRGRGQRWSGWEVRVACGRPVPELGKRGGLCIWRLIRPRGVAQQQTKPSQDHSNYGHVAPRASHEPANISHFIVIQNWLASEG